MLPDQVPQEGEGVWAPFFGRTAYTMTLPAKLAQLGKADILLTYAERLPRGRGYVIRFVPFDGDLSGTAAEQAASINRAMEQLIARCPAQYFWSYNRYKRRRAWPRRKPGRPHEAADCLLWLLHWLPLPILGRIGNAHRQPDVLRDPETPQNRPDQSAPVHARTARSGTRRHRQAATSRAIRAASWSAR